MSEPTHVAVLGTGVIGRSWAVLFLAAGCSVAAFDADPNARDALLATLPDQWAALEKLGLAEGEIPVHLLTFHDDPVQAVAGADFVQESVPERVDVKHALYARIEPHLTAEAIVATSASGLTLSELQAGWSDPSRFILGHPFNPPHLIPLVEVMGNERTQSGVVDRARKFYEAAGKVTIVVRREVPGHVANRLQAALWREAIHLVNEGVATVNDVDTAIASGPGLRWAVMGPTRLFSLGADEAGISTFCARYSDSFNRWWADLGSPVLDEAVALRLAEGLEENTAEGYEALIRLRDERLVEVIASTHPRREMA